MNTSISNKEFQNATEAFEYLYKHISRLGEDFAGTKAIFNVGFTLLNPEDKVITTPERKFNEGYASFEYEWYKSGNRDAAEISERAKIWKQMMIPGTTTVVSNYGFFWNYNNQLDRAIEELKSNPQSRRAMVVHYHLDELHNYKYDTPCNVVLSFYIKEGKLHLTVLCRSLDAVYGFSNDQYCFAKLMEEIAEELKLKVGPMHWHVVNMHIYPRHYDMLK